ncbi:MAG TPA: protein translocase subunit SecD [Blastocatellia bacterium]|nr:protein translocase subunit SecD [Blastocatellia bacterium]
MNKNLRIRGIIIAVVTALCLVIMFGPWDKIKRKQSVSASDFFKPSKLKQNLTENIHLGLDLKGGTHLVMQVKVEDVIKQITDGDRDKAEDELRKNGIPFTAVKAPSNGVVVIETPDTSKHSEISEKLMPYFGSEAWSVSPSSSPPSVTFTLQNAAADRFRRDASETAKMIVEQRVDAFGVAEPTIQRYGREENHQILVQMPGVDDPERVKTLIGADSTLEIRAVAQGGQKYATREEAEIALAGATDKEVLKNSEKRGDGTAEGGFYILEKTPVITGSDLRTARGIQSQGGFGYEVAFDLKREGSEKFGKWTGDNIGNYLAVVLGSKTTGMDIKSVAVVKNRIDASGRIEGNFTKQQAEDLGLVLRSGALPAGIQYLEERTVGPSLGAESIRQGLIAMIAGLIFVAGFMLFYYRLSGLNAVIALILNLVILLAGLAVFNATLTLPGIAGVILGIGMAVDANVLVFERIRDELRAGRTAYGSMESGFSKAIVTIIDTHVTTVVSAAILYLFGTGPIRGFAVTLVIGLLANLFTAVYVSKAMFLWVLNRGGRKAETISV